MARCVVIGNAEIKNYDIVKSYFRTDDYFVFCDGGLRHKEYLGVKADYIIGDFDSFQKPNNLDNVTALPCEKDDTDTFAAVKLMLKNGFKDFLIIGVIGQRLDHTFGNISILLFLKNNGAAGIIVDDYSEMILIEGEKKILKNSCSFFSVISLSKRLEGVNIKGAKYPLSNAVIESSYQYAISNEAVNDTQITVEKGDALLIKVF